MKQFYISRKWGNRAYRHARVQQMEKAVHLAIQPVKFSAEAKQQAAA